MIRQTLRKASAPGIIASRPSLRPVQFTRFYSTPLARETFISPDHVKIAASKPTMFKKSDTLGIEEIPIPASIRETGILPEGYSVDFVFDPSRMVKVLAEQNITTLEQIPASDLEGLKAIINSPDNLNILPTSVYEAVRAITAQTDAKFDKE